MKNIPAFPTGIVTDNKGVIVGGSNGMTLRDYFAAKAMQGVLANPEMSCRVDAELAGACYKIADEMLKAREQ